MADIETSGIPNLAAYLSQPWAVQAHAFKQGERLFQSMDWTSHMAQWEASRESARAARGDETTYQQTGSTAVIPISGVLAKKEMSLMESTSYIRATKAVQDAGRADDVSAVLLDIDSPGGTVPGVSELATAISRVAARKPVWAWVDGICCSAAYLVACSANRIVASPSSFIGSIGAICGVTDTTKADEQAGVSRTYYKTGANKDAGRVTPTAEHDAFFQRTVDEAFSEFRKAVMKGRHMTADQFQVVSDGSDWIAKEALKLGLIDSVSTLADTLSALAIARRV